jgi:hypothetical protein
MVTNAAKFTQSEIMPIEMEKTWFTTIQRCHEIGMLALSGKTIDLDKKFNANGYYDETSRRPSRWLSR